MLELSRALLRGGSRCPRARRAPGPTAAHYTKNAAGAGGAGAAAGGGSPRSRRGRRAPRPGAARRWRCASCASFFNAAGDRAAARRCSTPARAALGVGRAARRSRRRCCSASPRRSWVYAKSFMAEPLQALGLLLALVGARAAPAARRRVARGSRSRPGWACCSRSRSSSACCRSRSPCLVPLIGAPRRAWLAPALGLALALAGHAAYNVARFGTPFETGYGAQATAAAYTTPLLVGLYGLLLSLRQGRGVVRAGAVAGARAAGGRRTRRAPARHRAALERARRRRAAPRGARWRCGWRRWRSTAASSTGRATARSGRATWCRCCRSAFLLVAFALRPRPSRASRALAPWRSALLGPAGAARRRRHLLRRADARGRRLPVHAARSRIRAS